MPPGGAMWRCAACCWPAPGQAHPVQPHAPAAPFRGEAVGWFASMKPFCNAVEVEVQQQHRAGAGGRAGVRLQRRLLRPRRARSSGPARPSTSSPPATGPRPPASSSPSATRWPTRATTNRPARSCASSSSTSPRTTWRSTTPASPRHPRPRRPRPHPPRALSRDLPARGRLAGQRDRRCWRASAQPMTGPALLAPGTLLRGRYEILREIGRGGYSIVYQARDRDVGGDVAVKLLVPPPATAHLARERLRREVHAVRGLSHANIVAVYDLLDEEPWSFIVMEYVARERSRSPGARARAAVGGRGGAGRPRHGGGAGRGAPARHPASGREAAEHPARPRRHARASPTSARPSWTASSGSPPPAAWPVPWPTPRPRCSRDAAATPGPTSTRSVSRSTTRSPASCPAVPSAHLPPSPAPEGFRPAAARARLSRRGWTTSSRAPPPPPPRTRFPTAAALDEALRRAPHAGAAPRRGAALRCSAAAAIRSGSGSAPRCGGAPAGAADTLIFLQRPSDRAERQRWRRGSATLLPAAAGAEGRAAGRGERPLFRVTPEGSRRILDALERAEAAGARDPGVAGVDA